MSVTFMYVKPTEEQLKTMEEFRAKFSILYHEVSILPKNRGLSLALTKLEEASMWLNKSITENC